MIQTAVKKQIWNGVGVAVLWLWCCGCGLVVVLLWCFWHQRLANLGCGRGGGDGFLFVKD